MNSHIAKLFEDKKLTAKIKKKLPVLFQRAEMEMSRNGKANMAVGTLRENILAALLIYKFCKKNVNVEIPAMKPEVDVELFGQPLSIKTKTSKSKHIGAFKLAWTVDKQSVARFAQTYQPSCDILLAHIFWEHTGYFYYIPQEVQADVFQSLGREHYIKLPTEDTNSRGIEIYARAVTQLAADVRTKKIPIKWKRQELNYNPYERWLDLWQED